LSNLAAAIDRALKRRAEHGGAALDSRLLAEGPGWRVADVVCASGPRDRPFDERHDTYAIAVVAAGTFRYRAGDGEELMTPGSLMLGRPGRCYECGHEHGAGDRCVSFWYEEDYFEHLASDAGAREPREAFRHLRVPAIRELAPLVASACAGVTGASGMAWEELSIRLAAATVRVAGNATSPRPPGSPAARRRVAAIVRAIERRPDGTLSLGGMARVSGLSPFHFLRTFGQVTGTTPHQFVLRARLREAARRLMTTDDRVIDIALDCGFPDPPHFTHAFGAEFGVSPRQFRSSI
jgi:AraC-like DNA-binding protein